ncbi:hypothetical protein [Defluviicoccus vanus]|uniref:hypothetical protein n=1 Tax=Defluviicoccus vanus TaxID=111831 RepID=UPI001CBA64D5|nr:hypothetical protein [Defluviicoccus vanus]
MGRRTPTWVQLPNPRRCEILAAFEKPLPALLSALDRGKPHGVALVARARKLLIFANTLVACGTPWTVRPTAA